MRRATARDMGVGTQSALPAIHLVDNFRQTRTSVPNTCGDCVGLGSEVLCKQPRADFGNAFFGRPILCFDRQVALRVEPGRAPIEV